MRRSIGYLLSMRCCIYTSYKITQSLECVGNLYVTQFEARYGVTLLTGIPNIIRLIHESTILKR